MYVVALHPKRLKKSYFVTTSAHPIPDRTIEQGFTLRRMPAEYDDIVRVIKRSRPKVGELLKKVVVQFFKSGCHYGNKDDLERKIIDSFVGQVVNYSMWCPPVFVGTQEERIDEAFLKARKIVDDSGAFDTWDDFETRMAAVYHDLRRSPYVARAVMEDLHEG